MAVSPSGEIFTLPGDDVTLRFTPYDGWDVGEVVVDGVVLTADPSTRSYTFKNVGANHTLLVTAAKISEPTVPANDENVRKLIDHLVNGTPLDGNFDYDRNGVIDGRDLILLQSLLRTG